VHVKRLHLALAALLVLGCADKKTALDTLKAGSLVAVSVSPAPGGTLTADAVLAEETGLEEADLDDDGVDCENGLDPAGRRCDVVLRGMLQPSGQDFTALGMQLVASSPPLDGAAIRFVGALDARGRFVATSSRASRSHTARLVGRLESVRREASGLTLEVLGQKVHASSDVPVAVVKSVEAAAENDADGVTCEQNGQNEGDDVGC
jgi:hypothetical protein